MDTKLTRWIQQRIDTLGAAHKEAVIEMKSGATITPSAVSRVASKGSQKTAFIQMLNYINSHPNLVK